MKFLYTAILLCSFVLPAYAEKADRDKPTNIEADRVSMDDIKKVQIFEGNVVMTQGTRQLRTSRLLVTQDDDGFQKGVATGGEGGLARIRQKRDNSNDYMEGEAERIEHDGRTEKTEFFNRAWVRSGQDEVRGAYISYDALAEQYLASNGSGVTTTGTPSGRSSRVKAIIQPRSKTPASPDSAPALPLKPTTITRP